MNSHPLSVPALLCAASLASCSGTPAQHPASEPIQQRIQSVLVHIPDARPTSQDAPASSAPRYTYGVTVTDVPGESRCEEDLATMLPVFIPSKDALCTECPDGWVVDNNSLGECIPPGTSSDTLKQECEGKGDLFTLRNYEWIPEKDCITLMATCIPLKCKSFVNK